MPTPEADFPEYKAICDLITEMAAQLMIPIPKLRELEEAIKSAKEARGLDPHRNPKDWAGRLKMQEVALEIKGKLLGMFPDNQEWIERSYAQKLGDIRPSGMGFEFN